jgi:riboflavin synthase
MFTGIIESMGTVREVVVNGTNKTFWITSPLSSSFQIDQSVSHNGVCLTVDEISEDRHRVTAIDETLSVTEVGTWTTGSQVNLEQCLRFNGRLDGHIVQGHVDTTATCIEVADRKGSWELVFTFDPRFANLIIEKGSISVNGISLTAFNVGPDRFTVGIIPYTYTHTNISSLVSGAVVNLEFDLIGKYILRSQQLAQPNA